jgi:hypothetical protein
MHHAATGCVEAIKYGKIVENFSRVVEKKAGGGRKPPPGSAVT